MEKLLAKMYEQSETKTAKKQYRVLNALKAAAFLNLAVFYFLYNINVAQGTNPSHRSIRFILASLPSLVLHIW